jgi:hypothetical protein
MPEVMIPLAAVVLCCSIPLAAIYAFYRVRKLRTEERLAAIARGVTVPFEPELPQPTRSRRAGILLICGGVGYALTFAVLSLADRDALMAAAFSIIPVSIGIGYFLDAMFVKRELNPTA